MKIVIKLREPTITENLQMLKTLRNIFSNQRKIIRVKRRNRQRFDSIISDPHCNYLESIYDRLLKNDTTLTDAEILDAYFKFSNKTQTNTFASAEIELVTISVLCYSRRNLTEILLRRGLLSIVYSLGDNIDWFTVLQFINQRILAINVRPYGGLPPEVGLEWLTKILPTEKETIQRVLDEVIKENKIELDKIPPLVS